MFIYPRWTVDAADWRQCVPLAGVLALGAVFVSIRHRTRAPLAALLCFVGTLAPALGFFNVYPFRFSYVADHFQYLAMLSVVVPFSSLLARQWAAGRRKSAASVLAGTVLIAVLGALTWQQASIYRDAETLYRETVRRNPQAWMAYMNLGTEIASNPKRLPEAIEAWEGALRIRPEYADARRNVELARSALNDAEAATHLNRGSAYAETPGRLADAIAEFEAALRLKPGYFRAHYNLGTILMEVPGREAEAIVHLQRAVELQPDSIEAHVNLGIALADVPGRREEARRHLEYAIARRSDLGHLRGLVDRLR
jgi:tetratricopeptide (TPR) repeat protein